jgi:uncharacterized membrane protein
LAQHRRGDRGHRLALLPLVPLGLFAAGALMLWFGRRATRDDPAWISEGHQAHPETAAEPGVA